MVGGLGVFQHGFAEGVFVDRDDVVALLLELVDQTRFRRNDVAAGLLGCFLHHVTEDLFFIRTELAPELARGDGQERVDDVAGQRDVLLHLVELLGLDGGQRVLLGIDRAVLQRKVHLGKRDRCGVGAERLGESEVGRCVGHADLQAFHVFGFTHWLGRSRCDVACAVVVQCGDVVAAFVVVALGQLFEHVTLGVRQLVLGVPEDEREVGDGQRLVGVACKTRARQDDVHGAQGQALVDVGLFAQAGRGEHLDVVFAVGAFLDLLSRPHRVFVEGLRRFVHVGPFELGLRICNAKCACSAHCQCAQCYGFESISFAHGFVSVMVVESCWRLSLQVSLL